jgi:hypothetical protein
MECLLRGTRGARIDRASTCDPRSSRRVLMSVVLLALAASVFFDLPVLQVAVIETSSVSSGAHTTAGTLQRENQCAVRSARRDPSVLDPSLPEREKNVLLRDSSLQSFLRDDALRLPIDPGHLFEEAAAQFAVSEWSSPLLAVLTDFIRRRLPEIDVFTAGDAMAGLYVNDSGRLKAREGGEWPAHCGLRGWRCAPTLRVHSV